MITEWVLDCDPYTPPTPPDPCEESESETVTEAGCEIWNGSACVDVADSATITIASTINCCDGVNAGCEPNWELQRGARTWISDVYDCDSVPAEIELTINDPEVAMEYTLEFECESDLGWSNTTDPTVFTIPSVLTLTVGSGGGGGGGPPSASPFWFLGPNDGQYNINNLISELGI
jgi:hypothetical protein